MSYSLFIKRDKILQHMNNKQQMNSKQLSKKQVKNPMTLVNTFFGRKYSIDRKLGVGEFSHAYLAMNSEDNKQYVLKFYNFQYYDSEKQAKQVKTIVKRRIQIMKSINNRHVLKCHDVYENFKYLAYVTDYCPLTLAEEVQKCQLKGEEMVSILKQVIMGVHAVMERGVIVGQLESTKIFKKNGIYKISDFGLYEMLELPFQMQIAENSIQKKSLNSKKPKEYNPKHNVLAVGSLLRYMLAGGSQEKKESFKTKGKKENQQMKKFLEKSLEEEEQKRMSWSQLLVHPLFTSEDHSLDTNFHLKFQLSEIETGKLSDFVYSLEKEREVLREEKIDIDVNSFSFVTISSSDASLYNERLDEEEERIFQTIKKCNLECKKTQYLMKHVVKPIDEGSYLDMSSRFNIEFMYAISSRCFKNVSLIKNLMTGKENELIANFQKQIHVLYASTTMIFEKYSKALTKAESKVTARFFDRFISTNSKEKEIMLNGVEGKDYEPIQHHFFVKFTYIEEGILYSIAKKANLEMITILENYPEICNLEFQDIGQMDFEEKVEEIFRKNGKKTHIKKKN